MKMKLRPTSMLLNFALITCFAPSMFGSHDDDPDAFFGFNDDSFVKKPAQTCSHRGLELDDADTHCDSFDDSVFDFELTDKTPIQSVVSGTDAPIPYDRDDDYERHSDSGAEESDEDISDHDTYSLPKFPAVAKSTAITIRPRSQSELFHVKPKGKQRERSGSDPIAIPGSDAKLSAEAEHFSIGLRSLYMEHNKNKKTLQEHSLFHKLLKMSKKLSFKEVKLALDSLPRDSHSTFAFKIELFSLFMGNQISLIKEKEGQNKTHDLLQKTNKLLIMP